MMLGLNYSWASLSRRVSRSREDACPYHMACSLHVGARGADRTTSTHTHTWGIMFRSLSAGRASTHRRRLGAECGPLEGVLIPRESPVCFRDQRDGRTRDPVIRGFRYRYWPPNSEPVESPRRKSDDWATRRARSRPLTDRSHEKELHSGRVAEQSNGC